MSAYSDDMINSINATRKSAQSANIDTKFADNLISTFNKIDERMKATFAGIDKLRTDVAKAFKDIGKVDVASNLTKGLTIPKSTQSKLNTDAQNIGKALGDNVKKGIENSGIAQTLYDTLQSAADDVERKTQERFEKLNSALDRKQEKFDNITSIFDGRNPHQNDNEKRLRIAESKFSKHMEEIKNDITFLSDKIATTINAKAMGYMAEDSNLSVDDARRKAEDTSDVKQLKRKLDNLMRTKQIEADNEADILANARGLAMKTDRRIEIAERVYTTIKNVIAPILDDIKHGITKYGDWSNQSWNTIATSGVGGLLNGATASERIETARTTFNSAGSALSDFRGAVNYTDDYLKAFTDLVSKGFSDQTAATLALRQSTNKVLVPWFEQSVASSEDMMYLMKEDSYNSLVGFSALTKTSEAGNRLISSGVYGEMLNDMFDTLVNIEWNTGDATQLPEEYTKLMGGMVESGMAKTPQEAYALAKKVMDAQKDPLSALQSGDPFLINIASAFLQGRSVEEAVGNGSNVAMAKSLSNANALARSAFAQKSSFYATAMNGTYNDALGADAQSKFFVNALTGNYKPSDDYKKMLEEMEGKTDYTDILDEINGNIKNATSTQDKWRNTLENSLSTNSITKWFAENMPYFNNVFSGITDTLGGIVEALIQGHIVKSVIKSAASTEKTAGFLSKMTGMLKTGFGTVGGAIKTGFGKAGSLLKTGFGKVGDTFKTGFGKLKGTSGGAMGTMMGIGGLVWGAIDAYKGVKKADDWFADKNNGKPATTQQKITSGIGGFLGGTSSGLEGALSGAGKGAMIGSFFGPLGTVIGGAVGAGLGAIGGEKISKALDTATDFVVSGTKKAWGAISNFATDAWNKTTDFVSDTYKEVAGELKSAYNTVSDEVKNGFPKTKEAFKNASDYVKDKVKYVSDNMADSYNKTNDILNDNSKNMFEKASALTTMSVEQVKETASNIQGIWQDDTTSFVSKIGDTYTELASVFGGFISSIQSVKDSLLSVFGKVGGVIKDGFQKTMDDINNGTEESSSAISDGFKGLLESLGQISGGLWSGGKALASSAWSGIKDALGFKTGLSNTSSLFDLFNATSRFASIRKVIKDEMPIFVHKDEMVLNANDAKILRGIYAATGMSNVSDIAQYITNIQKDPIETALQSSNALSKDVFAQHSGFYTDTMSSSYARSLLESGLAFTPEQAITMARKLRSTNVANREAFARHSSLYADAMSISNENSSINKIVKSLTEEVNKIISAIYDASNNPDVKFRNDFNAAIRNLQTGDALRLVTAQGVIE